MHIGIPKEIKALEGRVGLVPEACADLVHLGHRVLLETTAGLASGYSDELYQRVGVEIVSDGAELYRQSQLIVKVKEPIGPELDLIRPDHLLFCYLHLAANQHLARALQEIGTTAIAFETVEKQGRLPLLAPMSDIAGRLSAQIASQLLHRPQGGKGLLLGGLPAAPRGHVVVIGGGVAGANAAAVAASLGAQVTVFDLDREKLFQARALGANVTGLYPYKRAIKEAVKQADIVIGAVLVTGEKAPHIVDEAMVSSMESGSVVVDISVDQGGCIATTRPTTYENPTYIWNEVVHFCVTNIPGAVPQTASQVLSAAVIPYLPSLADGSWEKDPSLIAGVNVQAGKLCHPGVIKALAS